jgi:hypothetical protein
MPVSGDVLGPQRLALTRKAHQQRRVLKVTVISPTVKWNVWVSGLQWSRSVLRKEKSYWKRVMRSFCRIASCWLSLWTNRAIGRRPAARSLKQIT